MRSRACLSLLTALLTVACATSADPAPERTPLAGMEVRPDLSVSHPPYDRVDVGWKQRIAQPYVFLEATGSYTRVGDHLGQVVALAQEQGLEITGPPFALYYDDPGLVPAEQLRLRACLPVEGPIGHREPLDYDVLESTTVVYAFIAGPYPEVPRAYPALFGYMSELGWVEAGPVRESYLVNPADVSDFGQLVTEVQIPATASR